MLGKHSLIVKRSEVIVRIRESAAAGCVPATFVKY